MKALKRVALIFTSLLPTDRPLRGRCPSGSTSRNPLNLVNLWIVRPPQSYVRQ